MKKFDIVEVHLRVNSFPGMVISVDEEFEEAAVYVETGTCGTTLLFVPYSQLTKAE